jgi:3-oxoacyl-[acyl-carrier-protein] synthase III
MSPGAFIESIEIALPEEEVTNAQIAAAHPAWRMDEVSKRTGVYSRRRCRSDETALDLAETACRALLNRTGVDSETIGALLFCTQTPDYVMPPNACLLQHRLGLSRSVAAFDVSLACSGFVYGLYMAKALVESGSARRVLLVTSETYSKLTNPDDRGPATLFGDGAAATFVGSGEAGIGRVYLGTDGSTPDIFCVPVGGARVPRTPGSATPVSDEHGSRRSPEQITMNGAAVLSFVQRELVDFVNRTMSELGIDWESLDLVVFHQASRAALQVLERKLDIPPDKVFSNLDTVGNTVSASIPIALWSAAQQGRLTPGMKVLLVGFGVGLSWGACTLTWQGRPDVNDQNARG